MTQATVADGKLACAKLVRKQMAALEAVETELAAARTESTVAAQV